MNFSLESPRRNNWIDWTLRGDDGIGRFLDVVRVGSPFHHLEMMIRDRFDLVQVRIVDRGATESQRWRTPLLSSLRSRPHFLPSKIQSKRSGDRPPHHHPLDIGSICEVGGGVDSMPRIRSAFHRLQSHLRTLSIAVLVRL